MKFNSFFVTPPRSKTLTADGREDGDADGKIDGKADGLLEGI